MLETTAAGDVPLQATAAAGDVPLQATAAAGDVPLQATAAEDASAPAGETQEARVQRAKRACLQRCYESRPAEGGFYRAWNPDTGTFGLWPNCLFRCEPGCGLIVPLVEEALPGPLPSVVTADVPLQATAAAGDVSLQATAAAGDAGDAAASAEAQEQQRQRAFAAAGDWSASQCQWLAEHSAQNRSHIMANGPEAPRLAIAPAAATAAGDVPLQATAAAGEAQEASLQQAKRDCLARCFSSPPADGGFSSIRNPRTGTFRLWSDCVFQCDPGCRLMLEKPEPAPAAADASTASLGFFLGSPSL